MPEAEDLRHHDGGDGDPDQAPQVVAESLEHREERADPPPEGPVGEEGHRSLLRVPQGELGVEDGDGGHEGRRQAPGEEGPVAGLRDGQARVGEDGRPHHPPGAHHDPVQQAELPHRRYTATANPR